MKYLAAFAITVGVLYAYATRHPVAGSPLPIWVDAVGGALILAFPISMLCRLVTKKMAGLRARFTDLLILFLVSGVFWAISADAASDPRIVSPVRFWFGLTLTSWATLFLPFVGSVALIECLESRKQKPLA